MRPFVIITSGRTGSRMLGTTLDKHPDCIYYDEWFGANEHEKWGGYFELPNTISQVTALHEVMYTPQVDAAIGFCLQYWHGDPAVWEYLRAHEEISVIHLVRANLFAQYVSHVLSQREQNWTHPYSGMSISLRPSECSHYFEHITRERRRVRVEFPRHPILVLTYEYILHDTPFALLTAQRHLGLEPRELPITTLKQNTRPLREVVSNYQELKEYFCESEWHRFFNE